jgi:uncharacterized protein involved in type VI secretion and phage assembly
MNDAFVLAKVIDNKDPTNKGRVKLSYPHLKNTTTDWVSVASIMAGDQRGCFFMPEIDDEVLVAPLQGDWNHPFVVGFVWNPVQGPPSPDPRQRMIRSKNGFTIRFCDSTIVEGNQGCLVIEDAHGHMITMTDWGITIASAGDINIQSGGTVLINGRRVLNVTGDI